MSTNLIITIALVVWVLVMETSCAFKKKRIVKRDTLHNYPTGLGDCPSLTSRENYDEEWVRIKAAELGIRPVDYLHRYNNKRWKPPANKWKNVGLTNNKEDE